MVSISFNCSVLTHKYEKDISSIIGHRRPDS